MLLFCRFIAVLAFCSLLVACGDETPQVSNETSAPSADTGPAGQAGDQKQSDQQRQQPAGRGEVKLTVLPQTPTSSDCLRVTVKGTPDRSVYLWEVNGTPVPGVTGPKLCGGHFSRGDRVVVKVGREQQGTSEAVEIGNSPPRIVDISSTPEEIYTGVTIEVMPVAEDPDGDEVEFSYQWVINGEEDAFLTDPVLPGDRVAKGDLIKVLITPNDGIEDGPVYESYANPVPNSAPTIVSEPPLEFETLDYSYQVKVADRDDDEFRYRLDEAPEGMTIDERTGLVKWSLTDIQPGVYTVAIIATDPDGAEAAQEFSLTLSAPAQ